MCSAAVADMMVAVAGAGGDAELGPGSAAAKIRSCGQQVGGGDRSNARDRAQHLGALARAGIGLDDRQPVLVDRFDAALRGLAPQARLA